MSLKLFWSFYHLLWHTNFCLFWYKFIQSYWKPYMMNSFEGFFLEGFLEYLQEISAEKLKKFKKRKFSSQLHTLSFNSRVIDYVVISENFVLFVWLWLILLSTRCHSDFKSQMIWCKDFSNWIPLLHCKEVIENCTIWNF